MANRQGDVDLRFAQVSAPVRTLAWLGLAWQMIHSEGEIDGDNNEKKKNQVAEPSWEQS